MHKLSRKEMIELFGPDLMSKARHGKSNQSTKY